MDGTCSSYFRLGLMASAAIVCVATATPAQAQTRNFNVPEQDAATGIALFGRQADIQLLISARDARGRRTSAVRGNFTVEDGLQRLLENTGLRAQPTGTQTWSVVPIPGEGEAGSAAAVDESAEIVVTGSHIRGVRDTAAPLQTISRRDIESSGYSTVEELFESLPQNFDEVTPEGRFANEGGSLLRGLNNSRATSVDLRGLGAQSTLTLVNGTRRAGSVGGRVVDISAVPLSVIERVEVVTGGRSAIYGADAVAGVVNIVTRQGFDGAQSQVNFSIAQEGGGERLGLSQLVGRDGSRGGFVIAYDLAKAWRFDLADVGLLTLQPNPQIGLTQLSLDAQARSRRHSIYLAGRYDLSEAIEVHATAIYSHRRFEDLALRRFAGATRVSFTDTVNPTEHADLSGGLRADLGGGWRLNAAGAWSRVVNVARSALFIDLGAFTLDRNTVEDTRSTTATASAIADGPLFTVAGITPRMAIGVEWRRDGFESRSNGAAGPELSRNVRSAFAELLVPFEAGRPGLHRLELSLAGRFDDYSDVGDTFNPQFGLTWEPVDGLAFRGTYSTAFRAPALIELQGSVEAFLELANNPAQPGSSIPVLFIQGNNGELSPEEAESWTAGVDWEPSFAPWARLSMSYFDVRYDGRIEQPSINADRQLVLVRADRFPGLLNRTPSAAEAAAYLAQDATGVISNSTGTPFNPATQNILAVFPNLALFDNRLSNIAVETIRGLDLNVDTTFETGIGRLEFGLNLTHSFEHERRVTSNSPAFSLLNEVGKPVDTRARLRAGWTRHALGAFVYVNHVDDYANPFSTPPSRMDSWTTVDLTVRFDGSQAVSSGFLHGLDVAFSIQNLLNDDPPVFPNSLQGVLYDSTNASPFGRYFALRLTKRW